MFMRVDFPEPEGPMIPRYSFGESAGKPPEGVNCLRAHLVELDHVLDRDHDGPLAGYAGGGRWRRGGIIGCKGPAAASV